MRERRLATAETVEKAGCVPIRKLSIEDSSDPLSHWQVLLIQSRFTKNVWAFPKGSVEPEESVTNAALRETKEEAGVSGKIINKLGYVMLNHNVKLRMFLMTVDQQFDSDDTRWMEGAFRVRKWFSLSQAKNLLLTVHSRPHLTQILDRAIEILVPPSDTSAPLSSSTSLVNTNATPIVASMSCSNVPSNQNESTNSNVAATTGQSRCVRPLPTSVSSPSLRSNFSAPSSTHIGKSNSEHSKL